MLARYRRTGADLPFADPRRHHGAAMEGSYWRFTDAASGTVAVVFVAVCRDREGAPWAMVGLAAHPGGHVRFGVADAVEAGTEMLHLRGQGVALQADRASLRVMLGDDARLEAHLTDAVTWPRRAFGGIGPAQVVPGLSQYWHPWLLHARAELRGAIGGLDLGAAGARAYAEKSWGGDGFPHQWWWGQAHDFAGRDDVCVAFAGGPAGVAGLRLLATSVVVRAGTEVVRLTRPPVPLRVGVGEDGWRLRGRTARYAVELEGHAAGNEPHRLPVPVPAGRAMREAVASQHLAGELRLTLRRGRRVVYAGTSALAGLERGGGPTRARRAAPPG